MADYPPVEAQLRSAADRAVELAGVRAGDRVLDVCCGTGNAAAAALSAGALVTGIDIDETVIQVARKHLPAGVFEVADAMHLPFADHSFDAAVSTFGVSFLAGAPAARELVRVVRDGGRIVITSWPQRGSILSAGSILRRAILEAQGRPPAVHDPAAWHDRRFVRDLFAPHSVEFSDEQILYRAVSPQAVAAQYYDQHPQWLQARNVVGEPVYAQLRAQATRFFEELNEHPSEWRATDRYVAAVVTLDGSRRSVSDRPGRRAS